MRPLKTAHFNFNHLLKLHISCCIPEEVMGINIFETMWLWVVH